MSRPPRAGVAAKPVTIRATADERSCWERCAKGAGLSLSEWLRSLANHEARETLNKVNARRARKA